MSRASISAREADQIKSSAFGHLEGLIAALGEMDELEMISSDSAELALDLMDVVRKLAQNKFDEAADRLVEVADGLGEDEDDEDEEPERRRD